MKKIKKNSLFNKKKSFKGGVDAGTVYGVLLLGLVLGGAYLMLGNIDPNLASPDQDQQVIIKNPNDNSVHSDLQLKDFPAITLTPSPTPTPTPTPMPTPPPPAAPGNGNKPLPLPLPGGQGKSAPPACCVNYNIKVKIDSKFSLHDGQKIEVYS